MKAINKNMTRGAAALTAAIASMVSSHALVNVEYNLTGGLVGPVAIPGGANGVYAGGGTANAYVANFFTQPAGTGVFQPFLTLDANGQTSTGNKSIESAYNTDGVPLYLDELRPNWNRLVKVSDLKQITGAQIGLTTGNDKNATFYVFELDANEPGGAKSLISVDNVRIYTTAGDNTSAVQNDITKLDLLGTKIWALNDPTQTGGAFNINNWVKLDAAQDGIGFGTGNGGSGQSDMILAVPTALFAGHTSENLFFYNLNGVHYSTDATGGDPNLAAQSGYEEWRAVTGTNLIVPDGGATAILLGIGALGLAAASRKRA